MINKMKTFVIVSMFLLSGISSAQAQESPKLKMTTEIPPGIDDKQPGLIKNEDGSYNVYFGPKAPAGQENNWVQTVPGKGWNMIFRLYGPLEPWFDKTWRLGDPTLVE